jgi:hypothetical protein
MGFAAKRRFLLGRLACGAVSAGAGARWRAAALGGHFNQGTSAGGRGRVGFKQG